MSTKNIIFCKNDYPSYTYTMLYKHGLVQAVVAKDKDCITIIEWYSNEENQGHTKEALKCLRNMFKHIFVVGIGENTREETYKYWKHMFELGLVDEAYMNDAELAPFIAAIV